jgi:phenylacetic acid degradation operon negative regulatory protein
LSDVPTPEPPRRHSASARSLLLTVLGEFVLPSAKPVWTGTVVDCLAALGVEEKSARQALARTATDGWITPERHGRRTRWSLTVPGRRLLSEGAERIYSFAAQEPFWDGRWLVLMVSVPERQRQARHLLRTRLAWAGFGSPAPGVWISANPDREAEAKQIIADLGLADGLFSFVGPFAGIGSPAGLVAQAWDLAEVARQYRSFIDGVTSMRATVSARALAPLVAQVQLVHGWRRMPFVDPQLPADLLPPDWIGREAAALFRAQHEQWAGPAEAAWTALDLRGG